MAGGGVTPEPEFPLGRYSLPQGALHMGKRCRIRPQTCHAVKPGGREVAAAAGLGARAAGELQSDGNFYSSPPSRILFLPRIFALK